MNKQAIIFIAVTIISILILTYVMIFHIFPPPARDTETKTPLVTSGTNKEFTLQSDGPLSRLHDVSMLSPTLLADGATIRAYEAITGHVRDIDLVGINPIGIESATTISDLQNIWWSPDGKIAITLREDENGPNWFLYDYITRSGQALDSTTMDVAFSPDSQRFAYVLDNNNTDSVLYTASVKGNGVERITEIKDPRPLIWWLTNDIMLVAQRPTGRSTSIIWKVSLSQKTITPLAEDVFGVDLLPSPDGSRILESLTTTLAIADQNLENQTTFTLETFVTKCVWIDSNITVVCAVPKDLLSAEILPDAYYWGGILTDDTFMVINTSSGRVVKTIDPQFLIDATNLIVPPSRDQIVFINRHDGMLYRLQVPGGF